MQWVRVHKIPDYAYFNHSAHIYAGVGCASCHGKVNEMEIVRLAEPLSMSWCLDCHRNPDNALRPRDAITDMDWEPPLNQAALAHQYKLERNIDPGEDCSVCHR